MKRAVQVLVVLCVVCFGVCGPARAEEVIEAWRSPFGSPGAVAVNPTDGTCWVGAKTGVWRVAADGTILGCTDGLYSPSSLSVNSADGSCWVGFQQGPSGEDTVFHLRADGTAVLRITGLGEVHSVSANPTDDSCWVVVEYYIGIVGYHDVIHLAENGAELLRVQLLGCGGSVSVNPTDGSCWVGGDNSICHLAADGTILFEQAWPPSPSVVLRLSPSVNPSDGSCWIGGCVIDGSGCVVHLAEDGTELWRGAGFEPWGTLSVNPADGSCWVADRGLAQVVHVSEDGTELLRVGFPYAASVSVNPSDGSCWVTAKDQVAHLAADGTQLWQAWSFVEPRSVSANASDGSCWVADLVWTQAGPAGSVVHLAADGTTLLHASALGVPITVSVNPTDGSCWVAVCTWPPLPDHLEVVHLAEDGAVLCQVECGAAADIVPLSVNPTDGSCWVGVVADNRMLIHLAADGTELLRLTDFHVISLSVNPTDGSCWVTSWASGSTYLVHLAEDGSELLRVGGFDGPYSVSVNSTDGSCWVADTYDGEVLHLGVDGAVLWWGWGFDSPCSVCANPSDGSCWVAESSHHPETQVLHHLAWDGTELWQGEAFRDLLQGSTPLSVNAADGSVWIADYGNGQVVHLVGPDWKPSLFSDVPWNHWAYDYVNACFYAGIVAGYPDGTYRPTLSVTRDQMAVYISRGLVAPSGDAAIPDPPGTATFSDVPTDYWAYKWVEYAVANSIVGGYWDGTYRPTQQVDRGQMAVFIARSIVTPHGDEGLAGYTPPETPTFSDVATDHWAYKYIEYIAQDSVNVTQGYPDGTYRPANVVTRDQMAVYVARAFHLPM